MEERKTPEEKHLQNIKDILEAEVGTNEEIEYSFAILWTALKMLNGYRKKYPKLEKENEELREVISIIIYKGVDIEYLANYCNHDLEEYNENISSDRTLTQKEFDLIEEYIRVYC